MIEEKFYEKLVTLKDGKKVRLRIANKGDQERIWEMLSSLSDETLKYFRPEGFTLEDVDNIISMIKDRRIVMIIAEEERTEKVLGYVLLKFFNEPSMRHMAELSIVVRDEWQGRGLGTKLMENIIYLARGFMLRKVVLTVFADNEAAIHLYRKFGFEIEGVFKKEYFVNNRFFTAYRMAVFL
ncbi:MAG: GNAT family N-acetyltransferase [Candidatus Asgardarchaeia archaeon]